MGSYASLDTSQIDALMARIRQAGSGDFKREAQLFLEGLGEEFLRLVQDEIINRKVVDTRLLLSSFHHGATDNVWVMNEGELTLEVGSNVSYAAYVNDGHYTNPSGVSARFVPGEWNGDRFTYIPGAKTGMVLKQKWVPGRHYWEAALRVMERMIPEMLDAKVQAWIDSYFSDFI